MIDIVEFLTARLDEDERGAREASDRRSGKWFMGDKWNVYGIEDETPWDDYETNELIVYGNMKSQSEHIARHDPARVLAEVAAKRAILALHEISSRPEEWGDVRHHPDQDWPRTDYTGQLTGGTVYSCGICDIGVNFDADGPLWRAEEACETVRWMAAPYADHPDYKQGWQVG